MFVESILSVLVLNDVQIPQNLLKSMDSLNRKPAHTCSFNWKSVWDLNQVFINSFRPQQICLEKISDPCS